MIFISNFKKLYTLSYSLFIIEISMYFSKFLKSIAKFLIFFQYK